MTTAITADRNSTGRTKWHMVCGGVGISLINFAKIITGLSIGLLVTGLIFATRYGFEYDYEDDLYEGKPGMFIIVMVVLVWLMVSYGTVAWVM